MKPGYDTNFLSSTPAPYESRAATVPTTNVDAPDRHHEAVDQRLLIEPITKKTAPVTAHETTSGRDMPMKYGIRGARPQIAKALNVDPAANHGERAAWGNPYSSLNIVVTQRSGSEVISSTTRSRSAPSNPFAAKIWRTSSRSPSGAISMWLCSMAASRRISSCSALVPRKLLAAIENPSANRFAKPMITIMPGDRCAPTTPVTTANVVTEP